MRAPGRARASLSPGRPGKTNRAKSRAPCALARPCASSASSACPAHESVPPLSRAAVCSSGAAAWPASAGRSVRLRPRCAGRGLRSELLRGPPQLRRPAVARARATRRRATTPTARRCAEVRCALGLRIGHGRQARGPDGERARGSAASSPGLCRGRTGPEGTGKLALRGATGAGAQRPGGVAAGARHDDVGPRHRRGRGGSAAHRLRRRRRHPGRHRRRLRRRRQRAHPRAPAGRRRPAVRRADRDQGRRPHASRRRWAAARRAGTCWPRSTPRSSGSASTTSTSGSCTPGTTPPRSRRPWPRCDPAVSSGRTRYVGDQQLHRLADRPGGHLAAGLAGPQPRGEHPGRVLPAPARRGAGGRAGGRGARAGRAGLVAAGPGPAHRQVPARDARRSPAGPLPQWQGFIDGLRSAKSDRIVEAVITAAEGLGTSPLAVALAWVRDRPGVVAPIVGARTAQQLQASLDADGRPPARRDPDRAGGRLGAALQLSRAPRRAVSAAHLRPGPRPGLRRLLRRRPVARPGQADGRRAARGRDRLPRRRLRRPAGQAPAGRPAAGRAAVLQLPRRAADLRGRRDAGRPPGSRPGWPPGSPTRSGPTPPGGCGTTRGRCSGCPA